MILTLFFLFSLLPVLHGSEILIPHSGIHVSVVRSQPGVKSADPVFDPGEAQFLRESGLMELSRAIKVEAEPWTDLRSVGTTSTNPKASLQAHPEQWALDNRGFNQEIELSPVDVLRIVGRAGEDIGAIGMPPENSGRRVRVAVVDTGIDLNHPDLQANLRRSNAECEAEEQYRACMNTEPDKEKCHAQYAQLDRDGNGYPRDCHGWSVLGSKDRRTRISGRPDPSDEVGHGTHVSGIISAQGRVSGAIRNVELIPVKVIGSDRAATSAENEPPSPRDDAFQQLTAESDLFARGVLYAIRSGAEVINLSLGYSIRDDSNLMREMIALAQRRGILIVAAAGNQSSRTPVYPCTYPGVICVASHSSDGSISHFSNHGDGVDLAAPGHLILSTWLGRLFPSVHTERRGYDFRSGTSMAAPFVAAAAARLLNLGIPPGEIQARLMRSARPHQRPTAMPDLFPKRTRSGNLNLSGAYTAAPSPLILPVQKAPLLVTWNAWSPHSERTVSADLRLKNEWANPRGRISLQFDPPIPRDGNPLPLVLRESQFDFSSWPSYEEKSVRLEFSWNEAGEPSAEYRLPYRIIENGVLLGEYEKSIEFAVPVTPPEGGRAYTETVRILDSGINVTEDLPPTTFKPIGCHWNDILSIHRESGKVILRVLNRSSRGFTRSAPVSLTSSSETLVSFECNPDDRDAPYAILTVDPVSKVARTRYFTREFHEREERASRFSTEIAVPDRNLVWSRHQGRLVPHFVAIGGIPEENRPARDPWMSSSQAARQARRIRLYRILPGDQGGREQALRLVLPVQQELSVPLLRFLPRSTSLLLSRGEGFFTSFSTVPLIDGEIRTERETPLQLADYQHLGFLPVLSVERGLATFWDLAPLGRLRLFVASLRGNVRSIFLPTLRPGDAARELLGASERGSFVLAQYRSRYFLHSFDERTGTTQAADPRMHESRTQHLLGTQETWILPEQAGGSLTTEVLGPPHPGAHRGWELFKPARYKTVGGRGCQLTDLSPADGSLITTLRYFCGRHFIEIPIQFNNPDADGSVRGDERSEDKPRGSPRQLADTNS